MPALQFIVAFDERLSPSSLAAFDKELTRFNGKAIGYLPDDAVLVLLPWSAVTAVGVLPGEHSYASVNAACTMS